MKDLNIDGHKSTLTTYPVVNSEKTYVVIADIFGSTSIDLNPEQLLRLRDYVNERVRELQFQGHLPS